VTTAGPIQGLTTDPLYLDVELPAGARVSLPVKSGYNAYVYPYEGALKVGAPDAARVLQRGHGGMLSEGDLIELEAGAEGARALVLAAKPLREPVVQYGPFVMNTREEIEQTLRDYQNGAFAGAAAAG
jgi:redox-sensitive bicupin YhaK (pirin superfamily)